VAGDLVQMIRAQQMIAAVVAGRVAKMASTALALAACVAFTHLAEGEGLTQDGLGSTAGSWRIMVHSSVLDSRRDRCGVARPGGTPEG